MICKKCGYDYPAKKLKCPYCGEVNPLGEKWKNEENLARKETLLTKARVIHSMPLYVADNRKDQYNLPPQAVPLPPAQMPGCAGG